MPRRTCWENWWTWSGSNRRPLPCHFSSWSVAERQEQSVRDSEGQCPCGSDASSLPLTCTRTRPSDSARSGQGWEGYDTSYDTKFTRFPKGPAELSRGAARGALETYLGQCWHSSNFLFFRRMPYRGYAILNWCNDLLATVCGSIMSSRGVGCPLAECNSDALG